MSKGNIGSLPSSRPINAPAGNLFVMTDTETFALPKDAPYNTITLFIDIKPWSSGPGGATSDDDVTDSLTLTIETPTVNRFQVAGSGVYYGYTLGGVPDPGSINGPPDGFGAMLVDGKNQPRSAAWSATVTNTTHYALELGFVQVVTSFAIDVAYTNIPPQNAHGTLLVDNFRTQTGYFYAGFSQRVDPEPLVGPPGPPTTVPSTPTALTTDSPGSIQPLITATRPIQYLKSVSFNAAFNTSLVVAGGWVPGGQGSPWILGVPIALSTANWEMHASAASVTVGPPVLNTQTGVLGPPTTSGPRTSPGDFQVTYLKWYGDSYAALRNGTLADTSNLANFHLGRRADSRVLHPKPAHGQPRTDFLRDHARQHSHFVAQAAPSLNLTEHLR